LWANSMALQAQTRNMPIMALACLNQKFGPCTPELLYETAAQVIEHVASGVAFVVGSRPREGKYPHYFSGLENCFAGQVAKGAAGMTRAQADNVIKQLLNRYESKLGDPPEGKKFEDCTDLKTLQPTAEWYEIYCNVAKELAEMGGPAIV
jgi:methylamine---corrinoid protein Co-methyltransferase